MALPSDGHAAGHAMRETLSSTIGPLLELCLARVRLASEETIGLARDRLAWEDLCLARARLASEETIGLARVRLAGEELGLTRVLMAARRECPRRLLAKHLLSCKRRWPSWPICRPVACQSVGRREVGRIDVFERRSFGMPNLRCRGRHAAWGCAAVDSACCYMLKSVLCPQPRVLSLGQWDGFS